MSAAILDDLAARGLIHDSTDPEELRRVLDRGPVTLYAGFDPTADSLHIGHLVPLLVLRRFQDHGHHPIALAGGATGMIGDPSGRSQERNLLDDDTLAANVAAISAQLRRWLDFDTAANPAVLVDNRSWTADLGVLTFLRDVGKHVTVNQMLAKESVRSRVASTQGISFTEFSYMLLQAHDFKWLHDHRGCQLQVGGSDQWGNITAGIDLIRKTSGGVAHGLTVPLVTRADGSKFGKTAAGAVWLDPDRTSPYEFFQYWMRTDDRDLERFLAQLTLLPLDEVRAVVAAHAEAPEQRQGQRRLAMAMTTLVHGEAAAADAAAASAGFTRSVRDLSERDLVHLAEELPTTSVPISDLVGAEVVDLLVRSGLVTSKSEGRRAIAGGGITVNDDRLGEPRCLSDDDLVYGRFVMLRHGKKRRHLIVAELG